MYPHPLTRAVLLLASAAALAACGESSNSVTGTAPHVRADVAPSALTLTCDIQALKANARDYSASNRDPLFTIIGDLQSLSKDGPNPAATDKAFDGLARLAAMRGTSAQSSDATGTEFNALTTGFLGCMESDITATVPSDFTVEGALSPGWLYEVRGKDAVDGADGVYERGADPFWGAEAPAGWGASISATSQAHRFLIYGSRITDFLTNDPTVGSEFELHTIPTLGSGVLSLSSPLLIGLCDVDVTPTLRVQHVSDVLPLQSLVCSGPPAFASATTTTSRLLATLNPLSMTKSAVEFFAPRTANAAFRIGSVGGGVSELSPSAVIDMRSVVLQFVHPVADGQVSTPLADGDGNPVQVAVTTQGGTPLHGVVVTLAIAGNESSIAFFQDGTAAASDMVTRTTGADGLATFTGVHLTKAGGYTLTATGAFDGVAGAPTLSNSFNMQNK
ncbi:MAG TPA: Ig-like domain-containing protein [Gemmatimonadaceae bacterium]|nr:Ig-like domain-containing protein [Gemmatimonadaceae bacterium]